MKANEQLQAFRKEMNQLDAQLCEALLLRKKLSRHIQRWKASHELPSCDLTREIEILDRLTCGLSREDTQFLNEIYTCILKLCKKGNLSTRVSDP